MKKVANKEEYIKTAKSTVGNNIKLNISEDIKSIQKVAAITKKAMGGPNVMNAATQFYSPRLTPDTWYLPRSRKMLLKWVDIFFDWDPYVYSILMMHSRYPISNFNLICDEKQREFLEEVLHNEDFDILDLLREMSLSFNKYGECIVLGDWDEEERVWKGFSVIDPGLIEVEEIPFTGKYAIYLEIPEKYKVIMNSKLEKDLARQKLIPQIIKDAIAKGQNYIWLDNTEGLDENGNYSPSRVCMIVNKTDVGEKGLRGIPPLTPILKTLVFSDYLRKAQMARVQRFAYPIEIWKYGDVANDFIPDDETLSKVQSMLSTALANPPYSIVYTPLLTYEAVGATGNLLNIYDDYNFVENQILVGLGTNKNIVLGEGGWVSNAKTLSLQRLIMDYQVMRDLWERKFLKNFVLRPLCLANGYYKKSIMGKTIPIMPQISWTSVLDIQNDEDTKKLYTDMWKDKLISTQTLFSKFPDLNFETEKQNMEKEKGTIFDSRDLPAPVLKTLENKPNKENIEENLVDTSSMKPPRPQKMDI